MISRHHILLLSLLIIVTGLIPVPVYFLESNTLSLDVDIASLPSRNLSLLEQQAQAFAGLLVKPVYMMLSLGVILLLIGQSRTSIHALQWGQIAFLIGETFCAINFYIYKHESILSEYLHSYGMALAFGFTSFALLEGWEDLFGGRIRSKVDAEAQVWMRFILPFLGILSFLPMLTTIQPESYAVTIFKFPYSYTRLDVYQLYERRILPLIAIVAFSTACLPLLKKSSTLPFTTKLFACAGIGALGFSLFRVALNAMFVENLVWFEFWEETTELMFVGIIAFTLWRYKKSLLDQTPMSDLFGV